MVSGLILMKWLIDVNNKPTVTKVFMISILYHLK